MRDAFEQVLSLQPGWTAKNDSSMQLRGQLVRSTIVGDVMAQVRSLRDDLDIDDLRVEGSDGVGLKTEVPWVRLYSESRSPRATDGWYLVYLFSALGNRVYLSLSQGTTQWDGQEFRPRAPESLLARVLWARQAIGDLPTESAPWTTAIKLDSRRSRLGAGYELGNVIAAQYEVDSIPDDDVLLDDLRTASRWLAALYRAEQDALSVPGDIGPEVDDALRAAQVNAGNARGSSQGFRLNTQEKLAIEVHAVKRVMAHLKDLGYTVKDVGSTQSYDVDARKGAERLHIEVKGTTSDGAQVILTRGEVALHRQVYPDNALAIVHSIELDRGVDPPMASGGALAWRSPWLIDEADLNPIAFQYRTGWP